MAQDEVDENQMCRLSGFGASCVSDRKGEELITAPKTKLRKTLKRPSKAAPTSGFISYQPMSVSVCVCVWRGLCSHPVCEETGDVSSTEFSPAVWRSPVDFRRRHSTDAWPLSLRDLRPPPCCVTSELSSNALNVSSPVTPASTTPGWRRSGPTGHRSVTRGFAALLFIHFGKNLWIYIRREKATCSLLFLNKSNITHNVWRDNAKKTGQGWPWKSERGELQQINYMVN